MKRLGGPKEQSMPLQAASLDLRSPAGKTTEGYFRLLVNAIADRDGKMTRIGGWKALTMMERSPEVTFAIVADQGWGTQPEMDVANMIRNWGSKYVVTCGDNIYFTTQTITSGDADARFAVTNTLQYGDFISAGRFFPAIGNHDTDHDPKTPTWYRSKFPSLFQGGTKNYYSVRPDNGPVEIFILSSGYSTDGKMFEPDGNTVGSVQYNWLRHALANSTAKWKLVVLHHPPYTTGAAYSPGFPAVRWDFGAMGADAVFSGHEHNYQRWLDKEIPYVVSGNGGADLRGFASLPTTAIQDNPARYGALRCTTAIHSLKVEAVMLDGTVFDTFTINKRTNEDLHDQLITNAIAPTVPVSMPDIKVEAPVTLGMVGVLQQVTFPEISLSKPNVDAKLSDSVTMPTISVVGPVFGRLYQWSTVVRTMQTVTDADPGWIDVYYTSAKQGGRFTARFKTAGNFGSLYLAISAYACLPDDATDFEYTGGFYKVQPWDSAYSLYRLVTPQVSPFVCQNS